MWTKEVSIKTTASKEQIWNLWTTVSDWNLWDAQVLDSSINGPFNLGQKGKLMPKGGPKSTFELIEVSPNKSFTSSSQLPLTKMDFIHTLTESNEGMHITHRIEISGFLTFLFARVIGRKLIQELPKALSNLVDLAEKEKHYV